MAITRGRRCECGKFSYGDWPTHCESCGAPLGAKNALTKDPHIQVFWMDRIHADAAKQGKHGFREGFHQGIGEYVTSKRDAIEKAKRKGMSLEFA